MKKLLITLLMLTTSLVSISQIDESKLIPKTNDFVYDFDSVFNNIEKTKINNIIKNNFTYLQVAVITINSLEGHSSNELVTKYARILGVGKKESDNGAVILLAMKERKLFTTVSRHLEGSLPDITIKRFQDDYAIPYFKNKEFAKGFINLIEQYQKIAIKDYSINTIDNATVSVPKNKDMNYTPLIIGLLILLVLIITLIVYYRRTLIDFKTALLYKDDVIKDFRATLAKQKDTNIDSVIELKTLKNNLYYYEQYLLREKVRFYTLDLFLKNEIITNISKQRKKEPLKLEEKTSYKKEEKKETEKKDNDGMHFTSSSFYSSPSRNDDSDYSTPSSYTSSNDYSFGGSDSYSGSGAESSF